MNTLFDKIWDAHVVTTVEDGPTQLYIDRLYCHEVTSPQAFAGLRERGIKVLRPEKVFCMPDHNTPTHDQDKPIEDPVSKTQVDTLTKNAKDFGLTHFGMMHPKNGIIHVVGPERGLTLPGMTIVCGDSHTSTHGAMGAIAFGIGTSEVEMVLASQCILQSRPKTMRITVDGELGKGVTAKDVALYMMSKMTTSGATGYFVEYAGSAIRNLTMEGRLTLCNLSIEMGARGGMVAPDEVTFEYIKGRESAPQGEAWDKALEYWKTLKSDENATFDKEVHFDAAKTRMIHGETQMNKVSRFVKEIPENLLEVENHSYGSKKSAISFGGKDSSESQGHFDFRANAKAALSRYGSGTTTYGQGNKKVAISGQKGIGSAYATNYGRTPTNYGTGNFAQPNKKVGFGKEFPMDIFDLKKPAKTTTSYSMPSKKAAGAIKSSGQAAGGTGLGYQVGDTVSHVKFGTGQVLAIEDGMRDYMVTVQFEEFGTKKMLAGFAKLKKQ